MFPFLVPFMFLPQFPWAFFFRFPASASAVVPQVSVRFCFEVPVCVSVGFPFCVPVVIFVL